MRSLWVALTFAVSVHSVAAQDVVTVPSSDSFAALVSRVEAIEATFAPSAPVVTAVVTGTTVDLSWDRIPAADGYRVERDAVTVATLRETSYQDTGLEPGTSYDYVIAAENAYGSSETAFSLSIDVVEDDDPPPPPASGDLVADQPAPGSTEPGDAFYDTWQGSAHRAYAFRGDDCQKWVDLSSMANQGRIANGSVTDSSELTTNTHVRCDWAGHEGVATFRVSPGSSGTPLLTDMHPAVGFEQDATHLTTFMTKWGVGWLDHANRDDDPVNYDGRPWRNSKNNHWKGKDDIEPDGDGVFKMNASFVRASNRATPDTLLRYFAETRAGYMGPNATDNAPFQPSALGTFDIRAGVWNQMWVLMERDLDGDGYGKVSVWMADEDRDPVLLIDGVDWRQPWDSTRGEGITSIHMFLNPKPSQGAPTEVFYSTKNLMVFVDPDDVQALIQKP